MTRMKTLVRSTLVGACLAFAVATPAFAVSVGGGEWNYGTYQWFGKHCYSNYYHGSQLHHATAVMGGNSQRQLAAPGYWANTDISDGGGNTCYAYWGKD